MKDGIINVYKPEGLTSNDVIYKMRAILGIKKLGHTGTLDPLATGVLPVCINKGTRVAEYMDMDFKTYRCTMILGQTTDTLDITGKPEERRDTGGVSAGDVEEAFRSFTGLISQIPPLTSAVRINGRRLYEYIHSGEEIPGEVLDKIRPRQVYIKKIVIEGIDLKGVLPESACPDRLPEGSHTEAFPEERAEESRKEAFSLHSPGPSAVGGCTFGRLPEVTFTVECSKGTYIRSICRDVGEFLGCGATMTRLERIASGAFTKENSVTLDELIDLAVRSGMCRKMPPEDPEKAPDPYKLSRSVPFTEEIPEVFEKYVFGMEYPLVHFGEAEVDPGLARAYADGWHLGYKEIRITKRPDFSDSAMGIRDDRGERITEADLWEKAAGPGSNHHGSYPGLKIHPEYEKMYKIYCRDGNRRFFIGTACHSDKYHKLIADKVLVRPEELRK